MRSPRLLRSLVNPADSKTVTCVAAFPDGKHMLWSVLFYNVFVSYLNIDYTVPLKTTSDFGMYKRHLQKAGARKDYHPFA